MKAVQYRAVGAAPEVVTVPDPEPGPGQVLLKVTAAGVCHSDIAVMSWPACGIDTSSDRLMSLSVPGTTITPVPMTKLPTISAHKACGSRAVAVGVMV